MKKRAALAGYLLFFIACLSVPVFGDTKAGLRLAPNGSMDVNISVIAMELYANEKDEMIRELGMDTILAGVRSEEENAEYTVVGEYPKDPRLLLFHNALISSEPCGFVDLGDRVRVTIPKVHNKQEIEKNVSNLRRIYEAAAELRLETAGMSDKKKAGYIINFICENTSYDHDLKIYGAAPMLAEGKGTCQGYAAMFYILGSYCGLEVKIVPGRFKDETRTSNHIWNQVELDGRWFFVDITSYDETKDTSYFLQPLEKQAEKYWIYYGDYEEMMNYLETPAS